ncbi:olfactory receptor 10A7-like [Pelobates fuscus]|uniref:olfactory receptor 10A7-like n=1 Tax=Pelobates fuscus TaxID=191477 RepID=UPI002FE4D2BA
MLCYVTVFLQAWRGQYTTWKNDTLATEFILLGFLTNKQSLLFGIFLFSYIFTFIGNLTIILIVTVDPVLQSPMYLFLRSLSITEIFYVSNTVPRMLRDFLHQNKAISIIGCATQFYFFCFLGATECFTLTFMAYDRYVAICHPLHYMNIMTKTRCLYMLLVSWMVGLVLPLGNSIDVFGLPFCKSNIIDHFFCEILQVMPLACADTHINELYIVVHTFVVIPLPFILIFVSYVRILRAVLKIHSTTGRKRTFSTCGSHLISVSLFFGSATITYLRTKAINSSGGGKVLSLMFLVLVPMLNPLIYSLRNTAFKNSIKRLFTRLFFL